MFEKCKHGALAPALLVLFLLFTVSPGQVLAQADLRTSSAAMKAVEEFGKRIDEFKKAGPPLKKKIEDVARLLDDTTPGEKDLKSIEEIRGIVSDFLGQLADNGKVWEFGIEAVNKARAELKAAEAGTGFTEAQQKKLIATWKELVTDTEKATRDLEDARMETLNELRLLQKQEDFTKSMVDAKKQMEVIASIRELTQGLRNFSRTVNDLIDQIPAF
jgi:uncharacterized coiled-coil DUF342 family protein